MPQVAIHVDENSTFFFKKSTALHYNVEVSDKEDATIDKKNIKVSLKYIPKVAGATAEMGHQMINENYNYGKSLISNSDCKACHQINAKSVGPSFMAVSLKYASDKNAPGYLANKIITGGSGVWGEHAMSAHPQFSKEDATEIVKYVLSVSTQTKDKALPQKGQVFLNQQLGGTEEGRYFLSASYTDKGGAISPLTNRDVLVLRPSKVQAESADMTYNLRQNDNQLNGINNGSYFMLRNIDLKDVDSLTYRIASQDKDATIKVHVNSVKGDVISTLTYKATGARNKFMEVSAPVTDPGGKHDLYFVFEKPDLPNKNIGSLDWILFGGGKEVIEPPVKGKKTKVAATEKEPDNAPEKIPVVNKKMSAMATAGMTLLAKSDCKTCHAVDKKLVGPSLQSIAKKYQNTPAVVNRLSGKIIAGGSGVWGNIPMLPHPNISKAERRQNCKLYSFVEEVKGGEHFINGNLSVERLPLILLQRITKVFPQCAQLLLCVLCGYTFTFEIQSDFTTCAAPSLCSLCVFLWLFSVVILLLLKYRTI